MEIAFHAEYDRFSLRDSLLHVRPLACELETRLNGLRSRVHGKNHVKAEHLCHLLRILSKISVVECARGERQLLGLLDESGHDSWVTVSLDAIDSQQWSLLSRTFVDSAYLVNGAKCRR